MDYRGPHGTAPAPADAAEYARALHDTPGAYLGHAPAAVLVHEPGASLAQRREALREVYGAIVARLGEPTLYGGSSRGPSVRWRDSRRTVLLSGDRDTVGLSVHDTQALEGDEQRQFAWSGAWRSDDPLGTGELPYLWRLDRGGPGEAPAGRPPIRPATGLDDFRVRLGMVLAAWVEQLPVQVGTDWASFRLTSTADRGRQLLVSYSIEDGLHASVDDRDGPDGEERALAMHARGWRFRDRGWWQTEFTAPGAAEAGALAELVVTELWARGTRDPEELRARDVSCKDRGEMWLPGLGIRH
ncbi:hypothetical protein [Streptomyces genisteinicus]